MPATLEAPDRVKCTYADCDLFFPDDRAMRRHKKYSDEHDYCHKCNEDYDSYEDYAMHKILRPDKHDKACRICGDEFKSNAGLKAHTELAHRVNQKLTCIGCQKCYYSATLFIEHLEFGHCDVISPSQFHGHIVHKHLVTDLLKNPDAMVRLKGKTAKFEAAQDYDEEGGVSLSENPLDDDEGVSAVDYKALEPDEKADTPIHHGPFPPLPTSSRATYDNVSVISGFDNMSISGASNASTVIPPPASGAIPRLGTWRPSPSSVATSTTSSRQQTGAWSNRGGKLASRSLFPNAKPTPAPSEFSISAYDQNQQASQGLHIMRDRFWDPLSNEFNADNYFNTIDSTYSCPFVCEQTFPTATSLQDHILGDHRITRFNCPCCLRYFKFARDLVAHCEARGSKCPINKNDDFNIFMDRISGGFLGVTEKIRPDHMNNPSVLRTDPKMGKVEVYSPPVAWYLQYEVTTPPDWKEPIKTVEVGTSVGPGWQKDADGDADSVW